MQGQAFTNGLNLHLERYYITGKKGRMSVNPDLVIQLEKIIVTP